MKQQQAFVGDVRMLKGGLHSHTTRSDGNDRPEEVIHYHYERGYDFLAITDHRIYNYKNYAPEIPLTIIPGFELDYVFEYGEGEGRRFYHTVCIGPAMEDGNGYGQDERIEYSKVGTQEEYQIYLDDIHTKGNLTIYAHPEWSATPARYFEKQKGNAAMEIWNSASVFECDMDDDAAYWDELLGQGIPIYGVATDDGHHMYQHCNGWVMVRAENNINSILEALKNGAFYSTCGPEIYNFYIEKGKAVIECSPVAKIRFHSANYPNKIFKSEDASLIRAEIDIDPGWPGPYKYVRASVIDAEGKKAWTNPIFID